MPDVQINTARSNEYNGRKVVLRDTHNVQMSIARFFQLALVGPQGQLCEPTQGYAGGHNAWDIAPVGGLEGVIPARCPVFGTVYDAGDGYSGGMGNYVIVQENTGGQFDRWHIFMHLYNRAVNVGDTITQGQAVGTIGNTGYSFGSHLHYQVATANPSSTSRVSEDPLITFDRGALNPSWNMEDASAADNWDYIQLDDEATDYGPPGGGGGGSIKALNIKLRINPPPEIIFNLRYQLTSNTDSLENKRPVNPGYCKPSELYEARNAHLYTESYQMKDTTKTDIIISWDYSLQLSKKPVLLFTTNGRDPFIHGRTTYLKQEGDFEVNDYERSTNIFPILSDYALPINIRAVLIDADDHSLILTRASAVFTRESMAYVQESYGRKRPYHQALLADAPATGKNMYSEDLHGYVELNETYESEEYYDLIPGLEEGDD